MLRGDSVFREQPGQSDFTGSARLSVDGVMVEADRIVIQGREVRFEGNVRLTLPRGAVVRSEGTARAYANAPKKPTVTS